MKAFMPEIVTCESIHRVRCGMWLVVMRAPRAPKPSALLIVCFPGVLKRMSVCVFGSIFCIPGVVFLDDMPTPAVLSLGWKLPSVPMSMCCMFISSPALLRLKMCWLVISDSRKADTGVEKRSRGHLWSSVFICFKECQRVHRSDRAVSMFILVCNNEL